MSIRGVHRATDRVLPQVPSVRVTCLSGMILLPGFRRARPPFLTILRFIANASGAIISWRRP